MVSHSAADAPVPFETAREAVVPYIGERAEALIGYRIATALGGDDWAARFRARLVDDDPGSPQVTEAERLLLEWADRAPLGRIDPALGARRASEFSPSLCAALDSYLRALEAQIG